MRLSLSRRPPANKSRDVRRRRSPSRVAYAKSYRDREQEWQRKLHEKHEELSQIKTTVAALELKIKDYKETIAELHASNKHQAGMLAAFAENEVQSGKRFERMNAELVKYRIMVNDLVTSRAKMLKQLQFEDTEWARERHGFQAAPSSHSQSSPETLTATRPPQSEEESSDSSQEEEAAAVARPPQEREQQPEQAPLTAENAARDRTLSAETLPMSPRAPMDSPARAATTDMPEPPTTTPMAFEPPPAASAPEGQHVVSAVVQ